MAIPGITFKVTGASPLTHDQMNNNFRSLFYSSSLHDSGDTLRLHFNTTTGNDFYTVPLNNGSGQITINGNVNNRVITATGTAGVFQGESSFTFDGSTLTIGEGKISVIDDNSNTIVGSSAGVLLGAGAENNTLYGQCAGPSITNDKNTAIGRDTLLAAGDVVCNVVVGDSGLVTLSTGQNNVAIGASAGKCNTSGTGNTYLGANAGPSGTTSESNKLYINNAASNTPLILGDFSNGQVTINSQVSASIFSGSFFGNGAGLTGLSVITEWDGSRNGDSSITGSLVVSGSTSTVDFTKVASISGSKFSGSFFGNGAGLTGVTTTVFPFTGSAIISGSLRAITTPGNKIQFSGSTFVSSSFDVNGTSTLRGITTIDQNVVIQNKSIDSIVIGSGSFAYNAFATGDSGTPISPQGSVSVGYFASRAAAGVNTTAVGLFAGQKINNFSVALGAAALQHHRGVNNIAIGYESIRSHLFNSTFTNIGTNNIGIGKRSLNQVERGSNNISIGTSALVNARNSSGNTALGHNSLLRHNDTFFSGTFKGFNTAIGFCSGYNLREGTGNVYIGTNAGPSSVSGINQSSKLYIASGSGDPLIGGDFATPSVTISGSLLVSQSVSASHFSGDGAGLTNLPASPWDGSRNGNASITGSLTVSGSTNTVDFTNVHSISGSNFSGSFHGNGAGLTGITSVSWNGTRNGNASITGSLIVSGALDVSNNITLASSGYPGGAGVELIHFHSSSLSGVNTIHNFVISGTGYTGFKADYSLSNSAESEKKIGTLLGAWDASGGETINDTFTTVGTAIQQTSFSIDSDGSNALLKVNAASGTYNLNIIMTAFKKQV